MFCFSDGCSIKLRKKYNFVLSVMKFDYFKTIQISPITTQYFNYSILSTIGVTGGVQGGKCSRSIVSTLQHYCLEKEPIKNVNIL
jgi:hypothetical protein